MKKRLRVLHIEDSQDDSDLIRITLESGGYDLDWVRVETALEMRRALADKAFDLIISDFNLPAFNASKALAILKASNLDVPFIVVSGCVGEEAAVALMKAGAHDYVMKDNYSRLCPAIERELNEAQGRCERRQSERELLESRQQFQELSMFLQTMREEDRTRIARELHDELGQALTALRMDLAWVERKTSDLAIREKMRAMAGLVKKTIDSIRRISEDLRPAMLDDLGLAAAMEHYVTKFSQRMGIPCHLDLGREDFDLADEVATALFRILQESLTNVARHAEAHHVSIALKDLGKEIRLTVADDGCGLRLSPQKKTFGLIGMRERANTLGGRFDIYAEAGKGTRIEVAVPLH